VAVYHVYILASPSAVLYTGVTSGETIIFAISSLY